MIHHLRMVPLEQQMKVEQAEMDLTLGVVLVVVAEAVHLQLVVMAHLQMVAMVATDLLIYYAQAQTKQEQVAVVVVVVQQVELLVMAVVVMVGGVL